MTKTDVSLDYFLFSVYETERTIRAVPDSVKTDKRWPLGLKLDEQPDDADTSADFTQLMTAMVNWYKEAFPKLAEVKQLNLATLADAVQPFAMMLRDMRLVVQHKFSKGMPYLQDDDADQVWSTIEKTFSSALPGLNGWFQKYFDWSYNRPVVEEDDDDSRPPTGRFAPSMGRRGGSSDRPPRPTGDRRPAGGGEKRDRPERGGDRPRGGERRPERNESRPPRAPRGEGRERSGGGGAERAEQEQQIIQEVRQAAEVLRTDPGKIEIKLRPANSFFRHLQHSEIKEQGFFSKSAGEGSDRSVVIMRDPDGNA